MREKKNFAPSDLLLPSELERKQLFHLIKKWSSYTAWERIFGYYKKLAEVVEASVRASDDGGLEKDQTSISYSDYAYILSGLADFEDGLIRLREGDKSVFTWSDAYGLFNRSALVFDRYETTKFKVEDRDIMWHDETPYSKEFFEALTVCSKAMDECWRYIVEDRYADDPAPIYYALWEAVWLPYFHYPSPLPEVPEPEEDVFVATGEEIACSGIWEPVEAKGSHKRIGAINYLHGGSEAPPADQAYRDIADRRYGNHALEAIDVVWRLIWRDDRYEDGTVPEEEKDYRFVMPNPPNKENPYELEPDDYLERHNLPNPFLDGIRSPSIPRVEGGEVCPRDGY
jgi:hypothetical protein